MKPEEKSKLYLVLAVTAVVCIAILAVISTRKPKEQKAPSFAPPSSSGDSSGAGVAVTELDKAKAANPDTVAWLTVSGTEIDNAVMQATDNEYYLRRDENGKSSVWGCYFADYYANLTASGSLTQNTVIYGHTDNSDNPNGQKFSQLFRYAELEFLRKNQNINLIVGHETLTFEIFAVFYTDIDFYYIDPNPSDQGFDAFMQEVNARNEFVYEGNPVTAQDKLLTLSGCSYQYDEGSTGNQRFVVMARLVQGAKESTEQAIKQNPSPKRP